MTDQSPTTVALRAALTTIQPPAYYASPDMFGPIHTKVCAVVDELKSKGLAPEHVILAVKGIAYESGMELSGGPLVERMVTWCLEQYFKDAPAA